MRIRINYAKEAPLRYTGALDVQRLWERALRRAGLPLAYSQGFHPQPRINQASPLPLGFTSRSELIDVWIEGSLPVEEIQAALEMALPPGIELHGISPVDEASPSIQALPGTAVYQVHFLEGIHTPDLQARVDRVLGAESLPRRRREKTYDLRPLILGMHCASPVDEAGPILWMELSAKPSATGRPDEVLEEMGIPPETARIERQSLVFSD